LNDRLDTNVKRLIRIMEDSSLDGESYNLDGQMGLLQVSRRPNHQVVLDSLINVA
jgi:hypothetical protein